MNARTPVVAVKEPCRVVALLSGGLDSFLAARLMRSMGHPVIGLHFVSPFFGKPHRIARWQELHGVAMETVDICEEFAALLRNRPAHGFGKVLNPCIDCKILMLRKAKRIMEERGACAIITGEVLGQRPMSQRRDALNVIRREAGVRDLLVRPLCAQHLEETPMEKTGFIDRSRLLAISGRSRKEQLALAEDMGFEEIPTPAGGCRLTERESARSYWPVLTYHPFPTAAEFRLANTGRQYWSRTAAPLWLCVGRNRTDNEHLLQLAKSMDYLFTTADFPGPVALARPLAEHSWDNDAVVAAAAFVASFSPKAVRRAATDATPVAVRVGKGPNSLDGPGDIVLVAPQREGPRQWQESQWPEVKKEIRARTGEDARPGA
jgi:hypothetical protein